MNEFCRREWDKEKMSLTKQEIYAFSMLIRICMLGEKGSSKNYCGVISEIIGYGLNKWGIKSFLILGEVRTEKKNYKHCWLLFKDKTILDATADQFNRVLKIKMPKIFMGPQPNNWKILEKTRIHRWIFDD